jgi:hypothetical protein
MSVRLPTDIHERAKKLAKRFHTTIKRFILDGVRDQVETFETKIKIEKQERDRERSDDHFERRIGSSALAPSAPAPPSPETSPLSSAPAATDALYEKHARRIYEVLDRDPREVQLRANEAVKAIFDYSPLTIDRSKDGREAVLQRLDAEIRKLREHEPKSEAVIPRAAPVERTLLARVADALSGRSLDPARIKSHGDQAPTTEK